MAAPDDDPATPAADEARGSGVPLRAFLRAETGGAIALVAAAIAAILWANSPWADSYATVWETKIAITVGSHALETDARGWVNQGLMTIFFLVVGLEAKRELDQGELRERGRLTIPVMAALGGMVAAVGIYLALNHGGPGAAGWGAAMSTDTALALGALAIVTPARAVRVRGFLLTLVVVDDLVALLVIAFVYSSGVSLLDLGIAAVLFGVLISLRFLTFGRAPAAVVVGVGIWIAMFQSGVDPVIAGLAIGLITSSYPPARGDLERATEGARAFREQPTPELAFAASRRLSSAISPNERLQFLLHPWTTYLIVPLFALANAGIPLGDGVLGDALRSPITIGIVLAFVVGKPAGIVAASWLGSRRFLGGTRPPVTWPVLTGAGATAGMGFTVSLLIATLAFPGELLDEAKIGILAAAVLSPALAWVIFRATRLLPDHVRTRQLGQVSETIVDLVDDVDPDRDHVRGNADASVTIVEYGDFECPFCGRAEPAVLALLEHEQDDPDGVRYVFRHLPLADVHPRAQLAAEASEAAGAQGAFWAMHDRLFAHQDELSPRDLVRHAEALELDVERFKADLRRRTYEARVRDDLEGADASGVSGTPTFFVNGRRHRGVYDEPSLLAAVQLARRHVHARTPPTD
ncbi:MAG: Na+/H+ antiporter NhaA [Patulibacter sp.]